MQRRLVVYTTAVLAVLLCGAAPPQEGELEVAGGYSSYGFSQRAGCNGPLFRYRVAEPVAYGKVSRRSDKGVSLAMEATLAVGSVTERDQLELGDDPPNPDEMFTVGDLILGGSLGARAGKHWQHFGFEAGLVGLYHPRVLGDAQFAPAPSARVWFGEPEVLYGYGDLLTGPLSGHAGFWGSVGVGQQRQRLSWQVGANPFAAMGRFDVPTGDLRVGLDAGLGWPEDGGLAGRVLLRAAVPMR